MIPTRRPSWPAPHRAGWTLIHLMVALSLLGVFLVAQSQLLRGVWTATDRAERSASLELSTDRVLDRLRRDVWSAAGIELRGPRDVLLRHPEGVVRWTVDPAGWVRRTPEDADGGPWGVGGTVWRFSAGPNWLGVERDHRGGSLWRYVTLLSQAASDAALEEGALP